MIRVISILMEHFLQMLERGDYRRNREIGYYAARLCVTPKYLSEVSESVSGYSTNYWINRYTALDISRQLRKQRVQGQDFLDSAESRPKKSEGQF